MPKHRGTGKPQQRAAVAAPQQTFGFMPQPPTFQRLCDDYSAEIVAALKPESRASYAVRLRWLRASMSPHPTGGEFFRKCQAKIAEGVWCEATANVHLKTARAVYKHAPANYPWAVVKSPFEGVPKASRRFAERKLKPRSLADPQTTFPRLLAAMPDAAARAFLSVMRWNGLRVSEALGLEPGHISFEQGTMRVAQKRMPGKSVPGDLKCEASGGELPMHPEVIRALRAYAAAEKLAGKPSGPKRLWPYVFRYEGTCHRCLAVYRGKSEVDCEGRHCLRGIMRILRAVAPEDFPRAVPGKSGACAFHVLRHTIAADADRNGALDRDVMLMLRHSTLATTQSYMGRTRGRQIDASTFAKAWGPAPATAPGSTEYLAPAKYYVEPT